MKTVREVTNRVMYILNCSQLVVSELIGASKNTLTDNKDKEVIDWDVKGHGNRLIALLFITEKLKMKYPDLPKEGFSFALRQAVRKDPQTGFLKSCLFLIHQGETDNLDYLESIAFEAAQIYYEKKSERIKKEVFYPEIFNDTRRVNSKVRVG